MTAIQTDLFSSFADPTPDEGRQRMDAARAASGPTARRSDPETSQGPGKEQRQRHEALALRVHQEHPEGLTDHELAALCGVEQDSIGVRRKSLERQGKVVATELRRPSPRGRSCIVWRVKS